MAISSALPAPASEAPSASSETQAVVAAFESMDRDGDGRVSTEEFLQSVPESETARSLRDFGVFDLDGDGYLTYEEFLNVPHLVPPDQRGRIPDPVVRFVDDRMAQIDAKWNEWDRDGDGGLNRSEFSASGLVDVVPGLEKTTWDDWDRDRDGRVSREDCRLTLEIAYGVRRPDGTLLRTESGRVFNWMAFKHVDRNGDDQIDYEEYVNYGFAGDAAEARFHEEDRDGDGVITFDEWNQARYYTLDPVSTFLQRDTNLDGRVDRQELLAGTPDWQQPIARHIFPAFDLNGDGYLSLEEFLLTPTLANVQLMWHEPRHDTDRDGRLSPGEFQWDAGIFCAALAAEYFRLLDVNGDGFLDLEEFIFHTDQRDPRREFAVRDVDGDGRLTEAEFLSRVPESEQARFRRDFRLFDLDGDGVLTYEEFLNIPHLVPPDRRGRFPGPLEWLVNERMEEIGAEWNAWDRNDDGTLSRNEFSASNLARRIPGLALSAWSDWDRDGDGEISLDECRLLMEIAYGLRRADGQRVVAESGLVVNWMLFKHIDRNGDGRIDRHEFVKYGFDGDQADARFKEADADGDGSITYQEWAAVPYRWADPVAEFLRLDTDLDGRVDREELLAGTPDWQQDVARYVFPGFDLDGDGFLSLEEYRLTPLANPMAKWMEPVRDSDNDGRLSPGEFQWGRGPEYAALTAEYFRLFDVNGDGYLDQSEFAIIIDPARAPRRAVFELLDRDGDGRLTLAEVLEHFTPNPLVANDPGHERRIGLVEEAFQLADVNGNGALSLREFESDAALGVISPEAAEAARKTRPLAGARPDASDGRREDEWDWPLWIIVGLNLVAVTAVVIFLVRKTS